MIMRKHQYLDVSQEELTTEAHESWSMKVRSMDDHAMVLVQVMVLKCHKVPDWHMWLMIGFKTAKCDMRVLRVPVTWFFVVFFLNSSMKSL